MNRKLWFDQAKELGFEGFEITESVRSSREMAWFESKMDAFTTSRMLGVSMRGLVNGKIVSISLEKADDEKAEEVLSSMKMQADLVSDSEKDELIPVIETSEEASGRQWVKPNMTQVRDLLSSLEKKLANADPRVIQVNAVEWSDTESESSLRNTLGVNVGDRSKSQLVFAQVTMKEGDDLRDGYKGAIVENIETFDQDAYVKDLIEQVAGTLNARSMKSKTCPVIFEKDAMTTLFSCFQGAFYGSSIAKGISPLTGKLGEKIFSDQITVIDDPRNQDALYLSNYDDEGHPTFTKVVVDHGVFEMILHNSRSALKMNSTSTGNGFKSAGGSTDVSAMNLYIVPGEKSLKKLEEEMQDGVVITELAGMHAGVEFVSGNFSLQARGYLVVNGKKVRPLTLITVAGNFFELMNDVVAVGNDLDWSYKMVVCPSILFGSAAIAGSEE